MPACDKPLELDITEIAYGGAGLARAADGKICFVAGTLPGERVLARVTAAHRQYDTARLIEVVTPSRDRVTPECPLALQPAGRAPCPPAACSGCRYQHATYSTELAAKQRQFAAMLEGIPGAPPPAPALAAPAPLGYRNKLVLHSRFENGRAALGYVMDDNKTVLDIPVCPLAVAPLNLRLAELRAQSGFLQGLRRDTDVTLRWTGHDGASWWRGAAPEHASWLTEHSVLGPISVPRGSFYQVNPGVADLLVTAVRDRIASERPAQVLDLYCGTGVFALAAASAGVSQVTGVEIDEAALAAAAHNAKRLGVQVDWLAGSARQALQTIAGTNTGAVTTVIVDPPRGGFEAGVCEDLARAQPASIFYISCAPDTMARDAARLVAAGYRIESAVLADMFPRTAHFESLSVFRRTA
ncbi:MAG: methyltransferase domain-containing protein [bacterium]